MQYYAFAKNRFWLHRLHWVMRTSLLKTLAAKHKSSVTKMAERYAARADQRERRWPSAFEVVIQRPGKSPLVATFGGHPLKTQPFHWIEDRLLDRDRCHPPERADRNDSWPTNANSAARRGSGRGPPRPEARRPQGQRPKGDPDLETDHGVPEAEDPDRLQAMPRRDPRRATDADARTAGAYTIRELTTGEPDAAKVASPVRRGADGKGRSRLPVTADANGLTNPGTSRTSPAAYPHLELCGLFQRPAGRRRRRVRPDGPQRPALARAARDDERGGAAHPQGADDQGKLNKARRGELLARAGRVRPAPRPASGPSTPTSRCGRRPAGLRQVRRLGTCTALLRYLVRQRHPHRRSGPTHGPQPGRAGVAAAEPDDAAESCCTTRSTPGPTAYGRRPVDPRRKQPGPAGHRQAGPPAGGVAGADPRPAAGLHHLDVAAIMPPSSRVVDPPPRRAEVSTPANHRFFPFEFGLVIEAG